ncbi:MAG: tetratricopeptide repeat protein [Terriglobales bacterium]
MRIVHQWQKLEVMNSQMKVDSVQKRTWAFLTLTVAFTLCGAGACLNSLPSRQTPFDKLLADGMTAENAGDLPGAEKDFQEAAHAAGVKYGKIDARVATCLTSLGQLYRQEGEYLKARDTYNQVISILETTAPGSADLKERKTELEAIQAKIKEYNLDGSGSSTKSSSGDKDKTNSKPAKKKHK